jgi:hypothetical protein
VIDMQDYGFEYIKRDKIDPKEDGFHRRNHGREAIIYFVENSGIVPIYAEMPGVEYLDILVFGETRHIQKRYYVEENKVETIPIDERFKIQDMLVKWLASKGWRHDIKVGE